MTTQMVSHIVEPVDQSRELFCNMKLIYFLKTLSISNKLTVHYLKTRRS